MHSACISLGFHCAAIYVPLHRKISSKSATKDTYMTNMRQSYLSNIKWLRPGVFLHNKKLIPNPSSLHPFMRHGPLLRTSFRHPNTSPYGLTGQPSTALQNSQSHCQNLSSSSPVGSHVWKLSRLYMGQKLETCSGWSFLPNCLIAWEKLLDSEVEEGKREFTAAQWNYKSNRFLVIFFSNWRGHWVLKRAFKRNLSWEDEAVSVIHSYSSSVLKSDIEVLFLLQLSFKLKSYWSKLQTSIPLWVRKWINTPR